MIPVAIFEKKNLIKRSVKLSKSIRVTRPLFKIIQIYLLSAYFTCLVLKCELETGFQKVLLCQFVFEGVQDLSAFRNRHAGWNSKWSKTTAMRYRLFSIRETPVYHLCLLIKLQLKRTGLGIVLITYPSHKFSTC